MCLTVWSRRRRHFMKVYAGYLQLAGRKTAQELWILMRQTLLRLPRYIRKALTESHLRQNKRVFMKPICDYSGRGCERSNLHLNEAKFQVTRLSTKGGFLRAGNTTIMTGVEDEKVEGALKIIEENSKARTQYATLPSSCGAMHGLILAPIEVKVGGATVFVLDGSSSTNIDSGKIQGKQRRICIHLRKLRNTPFGGAA